MQTNSDNPASFIKHFFGKHPIIANIICIFAVGMILVLGVLLFLDVWTHHGETSTVPEIKGLSYDSARQILSDADLSIEISDSIYDRTSAPGTVLESWPKTGAVVKRGRQVYVTITAFSPKMITISMPVIGVSSRQAVSYLEALGISSVRLVSVPSQYPDLVENAYSDGKTLSVGATLPVTASVTLEVGTVPVETLENDSLDIAIEREIDNIDLEVEDAFN